MAFDAAKHARFRAQMAKRIAELKGKTEDSLDFAMDHMMQDRVDSYFKVEEGLEEIDRTLALIEEELVAIQDQSGAFRLQSRLEFVEDRFEEFDSEIRQRPKRRRRRINFADFFKTAGGGGEIPAARGEIGSVSEAYAVLGLELGTAMAQVTAAFRQRAKKLHPDARKGDRSAEPELRRIIEAYQYLKEQLSVSMTEPPREV
ncbi:MAG: DnaJ domain-containing protein [Nitrospirota bacterium]|nr:DnaJ domain-containing protein [Nitrospirota bacterium]MDE3117824.1 DnaJ domain-containing protein [Nitrospirota bacterium]MDE3226562.1 DnaJ domain-containing protein [Nitrospirota bacterium]MDE3241377.1 DnaJ domain-containing protein [Nitrospirota bacterium]